MTDFGDDGGDMSRFAVCRKCGREAADGAVLIESAGAYEGGHECAPGSGCTPPAAPECGSTTCSEAATTIVHWPGRTLPMCDACARRADWAAGAMGFTITFSPVPK